MDTTNPTPAPTPVVTVPPIGSADGGKIDLQAGWNDLWTSVTTGYPGIGHTMAIIGVGIAVLSLLKWSWNARHGRGHGAAARPVLGGLIIGAILAAPAVVIPLLLGVLSVVANIVVSLVVKASGV
ncbi:hypothetical protein [Arthrobacter sp. A2-55]|uniref:hypothetical protein n=1 Tax=Arthrobacter sp. A2-55 TaxID=2897337 RepID=UPI0021CD8ABE|nr:hypothetical protein [Arthrobacter sp. A2-55]MCU6481953.1 hypothetical protein [Arthrobacter sp. A2-55]